METMRGRDTGQIDILWARKVFFVTIKYQQSAKEPHLHMSGLHSQLLKGESLGRPMLLTLSGSPATDLTGFCDVVTITRSTNSDGINKAIVEISRAGQVQDS